jgi:hypothetical protein
MPALTIIILLYVSLIMLFGAGLSFWYAYKGQDKMHDWEDASIETKNGS